MANYSLINSIFVVILLWFSETAAASNYKHDDGICKSMAAPQGYICEEHKVTTEDGYILSMQRLPADSFGTPSYKPPVLLQHGMLVDGSTSWLYNSPDESLGFILADNGYDVWIGNTRGTAPSQGHTSLCPKDPDYWNWSWDELTAYDLPATLNYVHNQTAQKLLYVGHSLGTLTILAALSQEKMLNTLGAVALLSPIPYLSHTKSLAARAATELFIVEASYWLGQHSFLPGGVAAAMFFKYICIKYGLNCTDLMTAFTGPNCCMDSIKDKGFLPQPTATKNVIHLSQMMRSGNLAMYDYGNVIENMVHYGQLTPPAYDLTMIPNNIPLFLGCGEKDFLSDERDVQILLNKLKDHDNDKLTVLKIKDYAHADFIFGFNANELVYNPLMDFLDSIDQ